MVLANSHNFRLLLIKLTTMFDQTHIHPMLVHFPIALLIVGFVADITGLFVKKAYLTQAGFLLQILGVLGVVAALISGNLAGSGVSEEGILGQAIERHEEAAELTIWIAGIAAVYRIVLVILKKFESYWKTIGLIMYFASVMAVARTGYYGGELVYKHAAGVQFTLGNDLNFGTENGHHLEAKDED